MFILIFIAELITICASVAIIALFISTIMTIKKNNNNQNKKIPPNQKDNKKQPSKNNKVDVDLHKVEHNISMTI